MPEQNGVWYCDQCGKCIEDSNFASGTGRALCGGCAKAGRTPEDEPSVMAGRFLTWALVILGVVFLAIGLVDLVIALLSARGHSNVTFFVTGAVWLALAAFFALIRRGVLALIRIERRGM